jgi:hypothetical protein
VRAELRRGDAGADAGAGRVGARRRPGRLLPAPIRLARLTRSFLQSSFSAATEMRCALSDLPIPCHVETGAHLTVRAIMIILKCRVKE